MNHSCAKNKRLQNAKQRQLRLPAQPSNDFFQVGVDERTTDPLKIVTLPGVTAIKHQIKTNQVIQSFIFEREK